VTACDGPAFSRSCPPIWRDAPVAITPGYGIQCPHLQYDPSKGVGGHLPFEQGHTAQNRAEQLLRRFTPGYPTPFSSEPYGTNTRWLTMIRAPDHPRHLSGRTLSRRCKLGEYGNVTTDYRQAHLPRLDNRQTKSLQLPTHDQGVAFS